MGRPTVYDPEIAQVILDRLAEGEGLKTICRDIGFSPATVRLWVIDDREGFAAPYARAREAGLECMAEDIIDISDASNADVTITDDGGLRVDGEVVQRARLRVDARKWLLSKLLSKRYGDRVQADISGNIDQTVTVDATELARRLAFTLARAVTVEGDHTPDDPQPALEKPKAGS